MLVGAEQMDRDGRDIPIVLTGGGGKEVAMMRGDLGSRQKAQVSQLTQKVEVATRNNSLDEEGKSFRGAWVGRDASAVRVQVKLNSCVWLPRSLYVISNVREILSIGRRVMQERDGIEQKKEKMETKPSRRGYHNQARNASTKPRQSK